MLALRKSMSSGVPQKSKNRKHPHPSPLLSVLLSNVLLVVFLSLLCRRAGRRRQIQRLSSMAPQWSQPWLPSRPCLAASYENVAQLVDLLLLHQCRAHHSTDDPNTWPSTRPSLAARGRGSGPLLVDHMRNIGSPIYHASSRTMVSSSPRFMTLYPSRLCG